jgi:hypothetical protein
VVRNSKYRTATVRSLTASASVFTSVRNIPPSRRPAEAGH